VNIVSVDDESSEPVGAERYERAAGREVYRSGHYARKFVTGAGEVELGVPKLRGATFRTAVIERYRRRETSVEEAIVEMYLAGVSTKRIEDVSELLWGAPVSTARTVSDGFAETLAYTEFPPEHWRRIRTNNGIERIDREIRRRTRAVGTYPDGNSVVILVSARLKYIAEHEWGKRRYLDMSKLEEMDELKGKAEG